MTNCTSAQLAPEPAVANSHSELRRRVALGQVTWSRPAIVVVARSFFMIVAQALVALVYIVRGHPSAWDAAAPWWTVYGTLADAGCLALLMKFTRREGIALRDLVGVIRLRLGGDIVLGIGCFLAFALFFSVPGLVASKFLFGTTHPPMYPGLLAKRTLPAWAVIYSLGAWWPIWSLTEEMTYNGYALPRIQALSGHKWIAVLTVGFWWALQHSFFPFILDWKYVVWRFLFFLPGVILMTLIYLGIRRLPPLVLAHWPMDLMAVLYTLKF